MITKSPTRRGLTLWLTGLSGAGKTTTALQLQALLEARNYPARLLDGDELRQTICSDLGYTKMDRQENVRRIGELAKELNQSGGITIVSVISPFASCRQAVRDSHLKSGLEFLEVFVNTPLDICKQRDPKNLYKKAEAGELQDLTGVGQPYETPTNQDIEIHPETMSPEECAQKILEQLHLECELNRIKINAKEASDLIMLGIDAYAPLTGFMAKADWESVCSNMQLQDGSLWPIPITLSTSQENAVNFCLGEEINLFCERSQTVIGTITLEEIYTPGKEKECQAVFGTCDIAHPGVQQVLQQEDVYLAGPIKLFSLGNFESQFADLPLTPAQTKELFAAKGWSRIAAFQTRNVMHRAHEFIVRQALQQCDAVLIHSLVGELKADDFPSDIRIDAIDLLIQHYFQDQAVCHAGVPYNMRYAGPREAVLHAIIRRNYGCTDFIVGRDHAGCGDYYQPTAAQEIFEQIDQDQLKINIIKIDQALWCSACEDVVVQTQCEHHLESHQHISGTQLRDMLSQDQEIPESMLRPEVAKFIKGQP